MEACKSALRRKTNALGRLLKALTRIKRPFMKLGPVKTMCSAEDSSLDSRLSSEFSTRYDACRVLEKYDIPCLIWGEDALSILGVPTIIFDLFLLVEDPEDAARYIIAHGFVRTKPNERFMETPGLSTLAPRLAAPLTPSTPPSPITQGREVENSDKIPASELPDADDEMNPGVVLLAANRWPHNPLGWQQHRFVPYTAEMLNCLISTYLDATEDKFRGYIAVHISYFYLYLQDVRNPGFEIDLLEENRQVHFDLLYSKELLRTLLSAKRVQDYHLDAREKIRLGKLEPGLEYRSATPREPLYLDKQQMAPWNRPSVAP